MNGIELEEFSKRIEALSKQEQEIAVSFFDDEILTKEIEIRLAKAKLAYSTVRNAMEMFQKVGE